MLVARFKEGLVEVPFEEMSQCFARQRETLQRLKGIAERFFRAEADLVSDLRKEVPTAGLTLVDRGEHRGGKRPFSSRLESTHEVASKDGIPYHVVLMVVRVA